MSVYSRDKNPFFLSSSSVRTARSFGHCPSVKVLLYYTFSDVKPDLSRDTQSVGGNKALSDECSFAAACHDSIKCTGYQFASGVVTDFDLRNL